tara:strand:+ start:350 stop:499 length:150 start_codon:yes stop_codon:yes gene_type:complete
MEIIELSDSRSDVMLCTGGLKRRTEGSATTALALAAMEKIVFEEVSIEY